MKPLQIGVLVLVGAMGGALIMRFTQRPATDVPLTAQPLTATAPPPAPATPPPEVEPPATVQPNARDLEPLTLSRDRQGVVSKSNAAHDISGPAPKTEPKPTPAAHHPRPIKQPPVVVARNVPPAAPSAPPSTPQPVTAPAPVPHESQEPPAPTPTVQTPAAPEPAAPQPETAQPAEPPAPTPVVPSVTLTSGLRLPVRLGQGLSSEHNQVGDTFTATLDAPLAADGFVIAERGARVEGRIVEAQKSSHFSGHALLVLELTSLHTSDGQNVAIRTDAFRKQALSSTNQTVEVMAAAIGIGAAVGAIAGGGKGAAIGAGAGAAVGAGGVAATRARPVALPSETRISFRLNQPVTLTERLEH